MAILNEKTAYTEKIVHLMITDKCNRKCPYCCNNQYDVNGIPYVTDEELKNAEIIFLTGGEPFTYADPCDYASKLKNKYSNLKAIMVYTNAIELAAYLENHNLYGIDGLTISIKCKGDKKVFEDLIKKNNDVLSLDSVRVYVFEGFEDTLVPETFDKRKRVWQKAFKAADDSIFRRGDREL